MAHSIKPASRAAGRPREARASCCLGSMHQGLGDGSHGLELLPAHSVVTVLVYLPNHVVNFRLLALVPECLQGLQQLFRIQLSTTIAHVSQRPSESSAVGVEWASYLLVALRIEAAKHALQVL
eukprot:3974279-Prymnesium_polylepis.1